MIPWVRTSAPSIPPRRWLGVHRRVQVTKTHTQQSGIDKARRELVQTGGGELAIKGRDGKVRDQNTIGRRDPEKSNG